MKISTQLQFDRAAAQMGTLTGNLSVRSRRALAAGRRLIPPGSALRVTTLLRLDALKTGQEARIALLIGPRLGRRRRRYPPKC